MSKKIIEHFCKDCGSEFMITWDEDYAEQEPAYCPFCSVKLEEDILYYEDDSEVD